MSSIDKEIDRLFGELPTAYRAQCVNPVTGAGFLRGIDSIAVQKRLARRALVARQWCSENGPPDLPPLPCGGDIECMKRGRGLSHLFGFYAHSIACRNYVVEGHPTFEEFGRGMLASPFAPDFFKENEELLNRFPPRPLAGLGPSNIWLPPKEFAEEMASYLRSQARLPREAAAERRLSAA